MILFLKNVLPRTHRHFKKFLYILSCSFILYNFKADEALNHPRGNITLISDSGPPSVKAVLHQHVLKSQNSYLKDLKVLCSKYWN